MRTVEAMAMISVGRGTKSMPKVERSYKKNRNSTTVNHMNVKRDVTKHLKPFSTREGHTLSTKEI